METNTRIGGRTELDAPNVAVRSLHVCDSSTSEVVSAVAFFVHDRKRRKHRPLLCSRVVDRFHTRCTEKTKNTDWLIRFRT